jgi:signal peptidase I
MSASPVPASEQSKRKPSRWRELLETVVLTVAIFLAVRATLQNFRVEGDSMFPTLHNGEYILVDKVSYLLHSPRRGDIIVFHAVPALQPDRDFIKRIVAVPGDTVAVRNGSVYINGHRLPEPYIHQPADYTFAARHVPRDDYFVLGDNRNNSFDSSKWTTTPWLNRKYIIGKAWIAYWPLHDLTLFHGVSYPRL